MQSGKPSFEPSFPWRRLFLFASFLLSFLFVANGLRAQEQDDVADAARRERARKAEQANPSHVYTDDDLKRDKILAPEDRAKVEARKKRKTVVPAEQNAAAPPAPADLTQPAESLGEIARRYRQEQAERERAAAASKQFSPFPYAVTNPKLADPKPTVAPLMRTAPERPVAKNHKALPSPVLPMPQTGNSLHKRLSPFQPRPLLAVPPAHRMAPVNPPPIRGNENPVTGKAGVSMRAIPSPAVVGSAETPATRRIQIQRGDSWWRLAAHYYGKGGRWRELRSLNPAGREPAEYLKQGSYVLVPESGVGQTSAPKTRITVRKGDTFWALSREHLGRGSAWDCLAKANPEVSNYSRLTIGTVLRLPSAGDLQSCQSAIKTQR